MKRLTSKDALALKLAEMVTRVRNLSAQVWLHQASDQCLIALIYLVFLIWVQERSETWVTFSWFKDAK